MQSQKQQQISEQIAHIAAEFLGRESNRQSLITVTRADVSPDMAKSTIYFTVMPTSYEDTVLEFARRQRAEFRNYIKKKTQMRRIPFFNFEIDAGEKHRQHLDTLEL
ncbi:MAG: ribosome-binding factor A [Candidatus Pacebacteria bacterium]|nr:ribosome-binding factor A [Candidatus Paceibacterota bacterium]